MSVAFPLNRAPRALPADAPFAERRVRSNPDPTKDQPSRVRALDAFRGFTVAAMLLVNFPGSPDNRYFPLQHATWHGLNAADVVFPAFLFAVGAAVGIRPPHHGFSASSACRRLIILFGLGLLLNFVENPALDRLRILGVFQRIAFCWLAAAILHRRIRSGRGLAMVGVALCALHWFLLSFAPFPGHVTGDLSPEGNLGTRIDRLVVGHRHMYFDLGFEPEGILGTVPAIATTLLGVIVGRLVGKRRLPHAATLTRAVATAVVLIAAGVAWGTFFPINKQLWTGSFVLTTGGVTLSLFTLWWWVIEVRGRQGFADLFEGFGANTLLVVVGATLIDRMMTFARVGDLTLREFIYEQVFVPTCGPMFGSFMFAVAFTLACWVAAEFVRRQGWFVRV